MRLLHLRWDHLPLLLEHHVPAQPGLVVLGGRPWDPGTVLDASPAASRAGVHRGQALGSAHALVPEALFLEAHSDRYRHAMEEALQALLAVTPAVEGATDPDDPAFGRVLLGIEGLDRLWGDESAIIRRAITTAGAALPGVPRAGIGNTRFGASVAAAITTIIPAGGMDVERAWLAPQPIRCLPADADTLGRLRRFGLTSVGDLAALPRSAVVARFGEHGGLLHDLANGLDARPLRPRQPVERLRAELEPESPIDGTEPLRFILHHLCEALCRQLVARGAAVTRATLSLTLEDALEPAVVIEQHLPEPVARPDAIERLLVARLETVQPGGRIGLVALELAGRQPGTGRQLGLFEPQGARADRFAWELAALAIRFPGQLWRTSVLDPEAARTEERTHWEPVEVPEGQIAATGTAPDVGGGSAAVVGGAA
jgi:protein ImuB